MALAVTHLLVAIVILDFFRHYVFGLKKFPRYLVVIGGIAGLAPDLDIPLGWIVHQITGKAVNYHGQFTHSLFFVVLFLMIGVVRQYQKDKTGAAIFYVIAAGWFIHLPLDCIFHGGNNFLWPISAMLSFCPAWFTDLQAMSIDAILLVIWLVHEEVHKKIKDYF